MLSETAHLSSHSDSKSSLGFSGCLECFYLMNLWFQRWLECRGCEDSEKQMGPGPGSGMENFSSVTKLTQDRNLLLVSRWKSMGIRLKIETCPMG